MSISEQIKELRFKADIFNTVGSAWELNRAEAKRIQSVLRQAANTIELLSEKLETANDELKRWHTEHINENMKNPFAQTSTLICQNCDHKDEYIEELEAEKEKVVMENMGRVDEKAIQDFFNALREYIDTTIELNTLTNPSPTAKNTASHRKEL